MSGPLVLVVDDDPVIVELVTMTLDMEGFSVASAVDGDDALAKIWADPPAAIVCDVMMPGTSGLDVLAQVRAHEEGPAIPFILLSAKAMGSDVETGIAAGADAYVTKPFEPDHLVDRVRWLVGHSRDLSG